MARFDSWASHEERRLQVIQCKCGLVHEDASKLKKVGWQEVEQGEFALLVNCTCRSTIAAETVTDACLCCVCQRLVTGSDGDFKVVVWDGESKIYCAACARRAHLIGLGFRRGPAIAAAIAAIASIGGYLAT